MYVRFSTVRGIGSGIVNGKSRTDSSGYLSVTEIDA